MSDTWMESHEDAERRRLAEAQARQADEDLSRAASTAEGFRFLLRLLTRWGAEQGVAGDAASLALRNEAERVLEDLARADPAVCLRMLAALRGIPFE